MVPRYLVLAVVGLSFFICVFVGPKAPFWGHFGLILGPRAPFWSHFGSHFGPQRLKFGATSFRYVLLSFLSVSQKHSTFDPFVSVRFTKTIYTSLRPPRPKLPKTFYHYASHKNFHVTQGAAVSRSVLRYIYIYNNNA